MNNEILNLLNFSIKLLKCFGFENIEADLSTRPIESIGEDNDWNNATQSLEEALNIQKISFTRKMLLGSVINHEIYHQNIKT